jgi:secreted trypsin-like serine protease
MAFKGLLGAATFAVALVGTSISTAAMATDMSAVQTNMTYLTAGAVTSSLTGGAFSGVGSLVVTRNSGVQSLCTGALLSSNVVLTAGHCLGAQRYTTTATPTLVFDPVASVNFYLSSYYDSTPATTFTGSDWWVPAGFSLPSILTTGNDYGLFTLTDAAQGFDTYDIFAGSDPLETFTRVGTGTVGISTGTYTTGAANSFHQRSGANEYELVADDLGLGWSSDILLSDFDDGTTAHDALYQVALDLGLPFAALLSQTGITGESDSSPGDSGGPAFINGQIVSVTSFGISADPVIGHLCGTDSSIDPYGAGGTHGPTINQKTCTNSSVGELAGDTWLYPHLSAINAYVDSHALVLSSALPEPGTWAQMVIGLGLLGAAMRRRVARSARAV